MPSYMKPYITFKGVEVFESANTHPTAKTKSFVILDDSDRLVKRVRFVVGDMVDKKFALSKALTYITNNLSKLIK